MCRNVALVVDANDDDNLSNLTTALVAIERGEGSSRDEVEFQSARTVVIDAIRDLNRSRFALGRALAKYREFYKQEQLWVRARKEIASALGCDPRTISRIVQESEAAAPLNPFVLQALENNKIDPGKKRHAGIVQELLKSAPPISPKAADAEVRVAVHKVAARQRGKRESEPIEEFTRRIIKQFLNRFQRLSPLVRSKELQFCFNELMGALKCEPESARDLLTQVREPKSNEKGRIVAA